MAFKAIIILDLPTAPPDVTLAQEVAFEAARIARSKTPGGGHDATIEHVGIFTEADGFVSPPSHVPTPREIAALDDVIEDDDAADADAAAASA